MMMNWDFPGRGGGGGGVDVQDSTEHPEATALRMTCCHNRSQITSQPGHIQRYLTHRLVFKA